MNPQFTVGWLEYAQARGFVTDPARVRSPQDKPRVERQVQYVRGNFFAGEEFVDLADAQARAETWCAEKAGQRIHGTICARPAEVFTEQEAAALLPAPSTPLRRADLRGGERAPRLPRPGRQGALLGSRNTCSGNGLPPALTPSW